MGGTETPTKKNRGARIINDSIKQADDMQTSQSLTYDVRPRIVELPGGNDSIRIRTKKNDKANNDEVQRWRSDKININLYQKLLKNKE